jgi:hypothetical protein
MPQEKFEPMIPVSERTKTFHALDHVATVVGSLTLSELNFLLVI